jgi:polar amino acid transport system substrate-binding protein
MGLKHIRRPVKWHRRFLNSLLLVLFCVPDFLLASPRISLVTFLERPLVDQVQGKPTGVLIDVVAELMRRSGVEYTLNLAPPKRALVIARTTAKHCVFPIERSQEREVFFQWITPILISRHGLYSHPDKKIPLVTLLDAKPYTLGSYLGSGVGEYLESFGFNVDFASRNDLNAGKLSKKRIDLWVSDTISARYLAKEDGFPLNDPELVFLTTVRAMGCHLNVDKRLVETMQEVLYGMYKDKTIEKIYRQFNEH